MQPFDLAFSNIPLTCNVQVTHRNRPETPGRLGDLCPPERARSAARWRISLIRNPVFHAQPHASPARPPHSPPRGTPPPPPPRAAGRDARDRRDGHCRVHHGGSRIAGRGIRIPPRLHAGVVHDVALHDGREGACGVRRRAGRRRGERRGDRGDRRRFGHRRVGSRRRHHRHHRRHLRARGRCRAARARPGSPGDVLDGLRGCRDHPHRVGRRADAGPAWPPRRRRRAQGAAGGGGEGAQGG